MQLQRQVQGFDVQQDCNDRIVMIALAILTAGIFSLVMMAGYISHQFKSSPLRAPDDGEITVFIAGGYFFRV